MKVVNRLLSNKKEENCKTLVNTPLEAYNTMRCRMFLKIRFLYSDLDLFPESLRAKSGTAFLLSLMDLAVKITKK